MNRYNLGQAIRLSMGASVLGVPTNPPYAITVTVHAPDGTTTSLTPTNDATGDYHVDFVIPSTGKPGVWVHRWQSSGVAVDGNCMAERKFQVNAPAF